MNRNIAVIALLVAVAVVLAIYSLQNCNVVILRDSESDQILPETTLAKIYLNPFAIEAEEISESALLESIECVDKTGTIRCGYYSGADGLYLAALSGDIDFFRAIATDESILDRGLLAINAASAVGNLEIVRYLLDNAGDSFLDIDGSGDFHPIIQAASYGKIPVLELFLDKGFDINSSFANGASSLFVEALVNSQENVLLFLLERGYEYNCAAVFPNGKSWRQVVDELELAKVSMEISELCESK